ncbi:clostripain-related cysteine peptidase [Vallitalea maricola]|uniref:Uncharacterized protein n=1 Tax=Vallitalea maricola TaxID=3074433 RepID=A0ACB5UJW8_9FIRM|nr:hypothetical protein AN2V17_20610 [Vallitalea sp. AN17-2]
MLGDDTINAIKDWTIMLYANGNNELEPETWQIYMDIQKNIIDLKNSNVVLQMAREPIDNLKILRPNMLGYNDNQSWKYTRRYIYINNYFELIEKLGNLNMADSKNLYDFILWASYNYPAKRYLLAIGGHVYQFVGLMVDYSQKKPYIAGFTQIASAIEKACQQNNIYIDILLLDTCYSSTIEVVYEFGKNPKGYIKYLLTYIEKGPITGIIYSNLIGIIESCKYLSTEQTLNKLINKMCEYQDISLIAYRLDSKVLEIQKRLFSNLAYTYLLCEKNLEKPFTPYELISNFNAKYPWAVFLGYLAKIIEILILYYKDNRRTNDELLLIHVLYKKIPDDYRKNLYKKLSFCRQNYWCNLICSFPVNESLSYEDNCLNPIEITKSILLTVISTTNAKLSDIENRSIVEKIIKVKGWSIQ